MNKTHEIDGVLYREVDRKAEAGDTIIVNGHVYGVRDTSGLGLVRTNEGFHFVNYSVLEPALAHKLDTDGLLDLIANLARRVTELERFTYEAEPAFEVGDIVRTDGYIYEVQTLLENDAYFLDDGTAEIYEAEELTLVCRAADRADRL